MRRRLITKAKVPVVIFKEGRSYVAYCPVLDLSTCGSSVQDAQRMFGEALELFVEGCVRKGTLERVLTELGWRKADHPRKEWIPPKVLKHTQYEVALPA